MRRQAAFCFLTAAKTNTWIANRFHTATRYFLASPSNTKFGHTSVFARSFARMNVNQEPGLIPAEGNHTATVIFLHGLGDCGGAWVTNFQSIRIPYIKYILPTAPIIPVTWQNGIKIPAWFNVKNLSIHQYDEDERGIRNTVKNIHAMVQEEIDAGIPSQRIILSGFSQGGGVALHSGLTFDQPLAALIGLSCRLPLARRITSERRINMNIPILHCHGEADLMTPIDVAQSVVKKIKEFNKSLTVKTYPKLVHSTCEEEMQDVKAFIAKHLPPK